MQKFRLLPVTIVTVVSVLSGAMLETAYAGQDKQDNQRDDDGDRRPDLRLTARPSAVVAPGRVVLTAELVGGADDFEEYYCPTIEWDWGDGTRSESTSDCDPYIEGQSEIRRRFTVEHTFRRAGRAHVYIRLKQRNDDVGAASVNVDVREGLPQR